MKMHLLSGGRLRMRRGVYYPDAAREETLDMPVSCTLLKHPQGLVLFDTGCHPSVASGAEARWGSLARFMTPIFAEQDSLIGQLPLACVTPDDIDTHAPLFNEGLGLDSIDALELGLALQKRYGLSLAADSEETRKHFASVRSLSSFVAANRKL